MQQGTLVISSNLGRYAVCTTGSVEFDDETYPDLHAGMLIEVYLGGHWVQGSVEFAGVYVTPIDHVMSGYYFIARDGSMVGLCVGTKVRIA